MTILGIMNTLPYKEYQKAYFEALDNPKLAKKRAMEREEELRKYGDIPETLLGNQIKLPST
jgi:hypothetical protein